MVFFSSALPRSPSAAEPLNPTLWLSGSARQPVRSPAGPGSGPDGGRAGLPPILGHLGVRAGSGPGPGPGSLFGGFDVRPGEGGCGASRVRDAGLCPYCSHPLGSVCCRVCLVLMCPLLGCSRVGQPEPNAGGCAAPTQSRGSQGAFRRQCGYFRAGLRPFFCSEQCADQGGNRVVGFIAGRSRWA